MDEEFAKSWIAKIDSIVKKKTFQNNKLDSAYIKSKAYEAFLKAYEEFDSQKGVALEAYLMQMINYRISDAIKHEENRIKALSGEKDDENFIRLDSRKNEEYVDKKCLENKKHTFSTEDPRSIVNEIEESLNILEVPEQQVMKHYKEGRNFKQITTVLGWRYKQVRRIFNRALDKIKTNLK